MNGTDVLILANTGTAEAPVWTAVGSQKDCSIKESNESIDYSSKNQREKRVDYGRYSSTVSLEALYVPSDTAYQALKTAMRAGNLIKVRKEELGVELEEADGVITDMSSEYPDQGPATISIEIEIDGAWAVVGS